MKRWCWRWTRRSDRTVRPPRHRVSRSGGAGRAIRMPTRSSRARTGTCGWSSWRPGSGAGCGPGWGSPRHTRTPSSTPSPSGSRSGARSARCWREQFAERTMDELVVAGQSHGVPIAAVLEPAEVMHADHFQAIGAMADAELVPGVRTSVPVGYFVVDGQQVGFRTPAPAVGSRRAAVARPPATPLRSRAIEPGPALFRPAHRRPRHHRRRRRAEPAVRRPGRRGHQGRERGVSRRPAAGQPGPGDERVVRAGRTATTSGWVWRCAARPEPTCSDNWSDAPTRCSPISSREPLPDLAFPTRSCAR